MHEGELLPAGRRQWRDIHLTDAPLRDPSGQEPRSRAPNGIERASTQAVTTPHRRQLEALIDLLRAALELETHCDFGDGPQPRGPGREAFCAHFAGWQEALEDWEGRLRRARAAPAALWVAFEEAVGQIGLPEPPLQVGPLVDRLATLTIQRSREGRLGISHALFQQSLRSGHGESARTTVYVEGQAVAQLQGDNRPLALEIERRVQRLFDAGQDSDAAREVGRTGDAVSEAKEALLARLHALAAADAIAFAPGCPVCAAQAAAHRKQMRPPIRSG